MEFAIKVILSFIIGGAFVSTVIWLSEHLGSRIGGAIAGIPSTILVSLASIGVTEGSKAVYKASTIIPIVMVIALFYAWTFVFSARAIKKATDKHLKATGIALLVWLVAAVIVHAIFANSNIVESVIVFIIGACLAYLSFSRLRSAKPKKITLPSNIFAIRFLIIGSVVALAVIFARVFGSTWGGIISTFPASFATSLYFLNKSQGCAFTEGFVKRLPASVVGVIVFIVILHSTIKHLPMALSFTLSMVGSIIYTSTLLSLNRSAESQSEQ